MTALVTSPSISLSKKPEPEFQFDFNDPGIWPIYKSNTERYYITKMRNESNFTPDLSKSERDGLSNLVRNSY